MGLLDSLFGSKGTSSSSSQVTMPDWLQQPAQGLVSQATELSKRAYTPYTGQTVAGFSPFQQLGIQQMGQMAQSNPVYGAAQEGLLDTIRGRTNVASNPYAGSNPYLGQQIDAASQDVVRNYNMAVKPQTEAAMVRSGSFGNSGLQQVQQEQQRQLAGELGRVASGLRFQDYGLQAQLGENQANRMEAERGRQFAALGQAPGFAQARFGDALALQQAGGLQQEQQQRELTDQYGRFMEQQQFPYQQLGFLSSILNPMQSLYRGETQQGTTRGRGSIFDIATNLAGAFIKPPGG